MERRSGYTVQRIDPIEASDLASDRLRYAAEHTTRPANAYRVAAEREDGEAETLEVLHFESTQRTGIARQDEAWWLDASAVEEALHRWMEGEGQANVRRAPGASEEA